MGQVRRLRNAAAMAEKLKAEPPAEITLKDEELLDGERMALQLFQTQQELFEARRETAQVRAALVIANAQLRVNQAKAAESSKG